MLHHITALLKLVLCVSFYSLGAGVNNTGTTGSPDQSDQDRAPDQINDEELESDASRSGGDTALIASLVSVTIVLIIALLLFLYFRARLVTLSMLFSIRCVLQSRSTSPLKMFFGIALHLLCSLSLGPYVSHPQAFILLFLAVFLHSPQDTLLQKACKPVESFVVSTCIGQCHEVALG